MIRIAGVLTLLICLYAALLYTDQNAGKASNLYDVANRQGFYGVLTLGAAVLILSGGIDLSMGSVVAYSAMLFAVLIKDGIHPYLAAAAVVFNGTIVGLINGLLVTRVKLQPFLVTLCGMFVYRGLARQLAGKVGLTQLREERPEAAAGLESLRYWLIGKAPDGELVFPHQFVILLVLAAVIGFVLHRTAYGRYWYAIGYNESAGRYAGVNVERQRLIVYVMCSALASFAGVLHLLDYARLQSDNAGTGMELEAITGAVLGGCSLRGGEGTVPGMVLGAMVLPVLNNLITFQGAGSDVVQLIIGLTLLLGVVVDEQIRGGGGALRWVRAKFRKAPAASAKPGG